MTVSDVVASIGFDDIGNKVNFDNSASSALRYASALQNLEAHQRAAVLSAMGLSDEQSRYVLSLTSSVAAVEKMTVAEMAQANGIKAVDLANRLHLETTDQLTVARLQTALAAGQVTDAEVRAALATKMTGTAMGVTAVQTRTLSLSLATLKAELLAMVATPLGLIMTLLSVLPLAIQGVKKLYDVATTTSDEAYEAAEAHAETYAQLKSDLESLAEEQSEIQGKISELESLKNNGRIIDESELTRLKTINSELSTTIAQKERLAEIEAQRANEDYAEAWSKKTQTVDSTFTDGHDRTHETTAEVNYEDYIERILESYERLNDKRKQGIELTEQEQDSILDLEEKLLAASVDIQDNFLSRYTGEDEYTALWHGIIDDISRATDEVGYFQDKLSALPNDATKTLRELAESGELTEESVVSLIREFPELADLMAETGMSAAELISQFNSASGSTDGLASDALALEDALNELSGAFDRVSAAQTKYENALAEGEYDQNFKAYAEAYAALGEEIAAGTVGREFWAGAEFFFGEDQLREWEWSAEKVAEAYNKIKPIFSDEESGGFYLLNELWKLDQANMLLDDTGNKLMEIQKNSDGTFDFEFDSDNLDEIADKLGITEEALLSCIEAMQIWGDIDLYDMDDVMAGLEADGFVTKVRR